ncbi:MAG: WXG100 family type VII secretion target [Micromonosporaceae bacterium]
MSDGIRVSPDSIRTAAGGIRQTADSFGSQVAAFQSRVQSLREPPGNDMISPLIWMAHDVVLKVAMDCMASNIRGLHMHADELDAAASAHESVERAHVAGINQLRGEV